MPGSDETRELTAVFNGGLTLRRSSDLPHGMAPQKSLSFSDFGILSPQLSGIARQLAGMGAGFSFRGAVCCSRRSLSFATGKTLPIFGNYFPFSFSWNVPVHRLVLS
jgi:hypothetical protein